MNLQSTVNEVGETSTQIIHFIGWEKRTFGRIINSTIKQGEFTKFKTTDWKLIMINTKNVLLVEVFKEKHEEDCRQEFFDNL
jgi:hypothetical protein